MDSGLKFYSGGMWFSLNLMFKDVCVKYFLKWVSCVRNVKRMVLYFYLIYWYIYYKMIGLNYSLVILVIDEI